MKKGFDTLGERQQLAMNLIEAAQVSPGDVGAAAVKMIVEAGTPDNVFVTALLDLLAEAAQIKAALEQPCACGECKARTARSEVPAQQAPLFVVPFVQGDES